MKVNWRTLPKVGHWPLLACTCLQTLVRITQKNEDTYANNCHKQMYPESLQFRRGKDVIIYTKSWVWCRLERNRDQSRRMTGGKWWRTYLLGGRGGDMHSRVSWSWGEFEESLHQHKAWAREIGSCLSGWCACHTRVRTQVQIPRIHVKILGAVTALEGKSMVLRVNWIARTATSESSGFDWESLPQ